jgi:glycosyltransferase involved in cell wall biosynthesis
VDLELTIVGGGQHLREMEARAAALGIGSLVHFTGNLATGQAVRAELDRADLFTLPSRQEGLPRAMIEAMARGLPAIGSTVGGIPELLPADDLFPPNDVPALAAKIREVLGDPERMARASARNLAKAREYSQEVLTPRRQALYTHVRTRTEEWLRKKSGR